MEILAKIGKWAIITILYFNSILNAQDLDELYFGTDDALDIMTWNIEWFPKNGEITIEYVAQIIDRLDMDILAIQEVDDTFLFTQMLNQTTDFEGYFESAWFAGLAYIYNAETIEINHIYEISFLTSLF